MYVFAGITTILVKLSHTHNTLFFILLLLIYFKQIKSQSFYARQICRLTANQTILPLRTTASILPHSVSLNASGIASRLAYIRSDRH